MRLKSQHAGDEVDVGQDIDDDSLAVEVARLGSVPDLGGGLDLSRPEFQHLQDDLWLYGFKTLKSFLRTGRIIGLCSRLGAPVFMTEEVQRTLHSSRDDRDALAVDTLLQAMPYFRRKVLERGNWDHRRSSLRTFFVGCCVLTFPTVFRRWLRQRNQQLGDYGFGVSYTDLAEQLSPRLADDPETVTQLRTMLTRIMRRARPEARMICSLILKDLTYAEIGERLDGISARAVEGHMRRLRRTVYAMGRRGEIELPDSARQAPKTTERAE
jgi:DNA-directed RNA polymerase specialized sigma24 family protein